MFPEIDFKIRKFLSENTAKYKVVSSGEAFFGEFLFMFQKITETEKEIDLCISYSPKTKTYILRSDGSSVIESESLEEILNLVKEQKPRSLIL
jgi:hypothetical protein